MSYELRFILETTKKENKQLNTYFVAEFNIPKDETLHELLGYSTKKTSQITTKGLPTKYSDYTNKILNDYESKNIGKTPTISFLNINELSEIYKTWEGEQPKGSKLAEIQIILSMMNSFKINEWGEPTLIYGFFPN